MEQALPIPMLKGSFAKGAFRAIRLLLEEKLSPNGD
jgi:hypothetical protein